MAIAYHVKGSRRRAIALKQQNAAEIRAGRPALIIAAGEGRGKRA